MKCIYDCGIEHGYAEPCASPASPYYDSSLQPVAVKPKDPQPGVAEVELGAEASEPLTQVERNQRWRDKNRERYNEYMRKYRARKKEK